MGNQINTRRGDVENNREENAIRNAIKTGNDLLLKACS